VFFGDEDGFDYLRLLRESADEAALKVWAYALMPNHVHLVAVPSKTESLARALGIAHRRYAARINRREGWTGHLWGCRFFLTPLDEAHLWSAVRYVELNPVRAGLARTASDYPWSSARAHARGAPDALLDLDRPFPGCMHDWDGWLDSGLDDPRVDAIRRGTSTGHPTGSEDSKRRLESMVGPSLPKREGQPPRLRGSCPLKSRLLPPTDPSR
jgi:putative transposase